MYYKIKKYYLIFNRFNLKGVYCFYINITI